jgi:hypothetical protein
VHAFERKQKPKRENRSPVFADPGTTFFGQTPAINRTRGVCACGGGCPNCLNNRNAQPFAIQKKSLEISVPTDASEKEADEVARKVVDGQPAEIHQTSTAVNKKAESPPEITREFQSKLENSKGSGRSLDDSTRTEMESKMSADFSRVKIHTGGDAHHMNESVNAKAFTHGDDIYFKTGNYDPGSTRGVELLAHELTHVIQQRGSSINPGVQRQAESDEESEPYPEQEMDSASVDDDSESKMPGSDDADFDDELEDESEEHADVSQEPGDSDVKTEEVAEPAEGPRKKKKKPLKFRRKPHRTKSFSGRTGIFRGKRGKYRRNWQWTWGNVETQRDPPTKKTREQTLTASDSAEAEAGDSKITAHGALFYKNEAIAGIVELSNYEEEAEVSVTPPTPSLAFNETGAQISSSTSVTGTLQYKFGEESDPPRGPRGRILVERLDPLTGSWITVHDTAMITTKGQWRTDRLDSKLSPDAKYRVRVFTQYWENTFSPGYQWGDGRTQVDYSFKIQQSVTTKVAITKTRVGKSKITKKARSFRLRL